MNHRLGAWIGPATLCALLTLTGCATAPAEPGPSALPAVARAWQAPLPGGDASVDLASWWERFKDPLLPPLIATAQQASPTLASASARIARARATRTAAGASLVPRLDAVGAASQGRATPGAPVLGSASLGLQAGWEIDLFGAGAAGRDAAQARLEGARAAWQDAHIAVAAEVASAYVALRACEAQAAQSRLDADSRAETARLTDLTASAGFTAPADAALVRAGAAQSRSQAVSQRAACDSMVKSLVELTDLAEPELRQRLFVRTAQLPQPPAIAPTAVPAALLAQRPDLAVAARNVVAAAGDRAQASARQRPQLSLAGSVAGVRLQSAQSTVSGTTWSLGPLTVSLPVFDGGALAAASAAAQAGYDEAVALYQAQVRRAVREVEDSLIHLQASAEQEADVRLAAKDFETSLRATQARQRGGLASLLELEVSRRNAVAAQSALIELQRERAVAWIGLYRALGGGWSEATPDTAATP